MSAFRASDNYPANCRQHPEGCWSIATDGWQISSDNRAAILLADILGVNMSRRSPGDAAPSCPWDASTGGYRTDVRIRFAGPHAAEVGLGLSCVSQGRGRVMGFSQWQKFEVARASGAWTAHIVERGIT